MTTVPVKVDFTPEEIRDFVLHGLLSRVKGGEYYMTELGQEIVNKYLKKVLNDLDYLKEVKLELARISALMSNLPSKDGAMPEDPVPSWWTDEMDQRMCQAFALVEHTIGELER